MLKKIGKLALCLILCLGVGYIGSTFSQSALESWYPSLNQPRGTPPSAAFAPVWIFLYVLMGISLWWASSARAPKQALALFYLQLLFNLLWPFFFFGMQNIFLSLIDILLLDICLIATIWAFWQSSRPAALLLLPYLAWIVYATYLNIALFSLNT